MICNTVYIHGRWEKTTKYICVLKLPLSAVDAINHRDDAYIPTAPNAKGISQKYHLVLNIKRRLYYNWKTETPFFLR